MENGNKVKRFSLYLFYTKNEDEYTIYNHKKKKLGKFTQKFNENHKELLLSDYEFEETEVDCLHELLFFQIQIAIIVQAEKLIIKGFPLKAKLIEPVIFIYKKKYGERRIEIEEFEEVSDYEISNLVLIINQPRRTHYIQQAYLRNFSSNTEKWKSIKKPHRARIFVYDKINEKIINIGNTPSENDYGQKIENIAKEDYFYSLELEDLMANTLEKEIPEIFEKIISDKSTKSLTLSQKEIIIKYILLTWSRTPESREHFRESYEKGGKKGIELFSEFNLSKDEKMVINDNYLRFLHENHIINLFFPIKDDNLINHLLTFNFGVKKARDPFYFITSDNPIILYNSYYEKQKQISNDFIKKRRQEALDRMSQDKRVASVIVLTSNHPERAPKVKGVEIYLPLSPKICLFLVDKQKGTKLLSVERVVSETIQQANQFLYTHKGDFKYIKQIIKENPKCKDKKGKRVIVKGEKLNPKGKGGSKIKALKIDDILKKDDFLE